MSEQWRPIKGYEDKYDVSDLGQVRSWTSVKQGGLLKPREQNSGYLQVNLKDGKGHGLNKTVHSLVAVAFLGPRPDGLEVRHLDGNGHNNKLSNLCYGTRSDNRLDASRHGTLHNPNPKRDVCNRNHPMSGANLKLVGKRNKRVCVECRRMRDRKDWVGGTGLGQAEQRALN